MELINEMLSLPWDVFILLFLVFASVFLAFSLSCFVIGFISYKLTSLAINYISSEKLNVRIINKNGAEEIHIIKYKKGDDISTAIKKLKGS